MPAGKDPPYNQWGPITAPSPDRCRASKYGLSKPEVTVYPRLYNVTRRVPSHKNNTRSVRLLLNHIKFFIKKHDKPILFSYTNRTNNVSSEIIDIGVVNNGKWPWVLAVSILAPRWNSIGER